ncbi:MAG: helix-turn-helix domain-containing protein [Clostridia bacterium]|nr:helix-turn-helix domain-containing protein [Clostridia bacterium]
MQRTGAMPDSVKRRIVSEKELPNLIGETLLVDLLGLSRTYIYYLLRQQRFKTITKGSRIYVRKKELLSWLESLEGGQHGKA